MGKPEGSIMDGWIVGGFFFEGWEIEREEEGVGFVGMFMYIIREDRRIYILGRTKRDGWFFDISIFLVPFFWILSFVFLVRDVRGVVK